MTDQHSNSTDILDDEIRIISPTGEPPTPPSGKVEPRFPWWGWAAAAVIIVLVLALVLSIRCNTAYEEEEIGEAKITESPKAEAVEDATLTASTAAAPYTELTDTIINGKKLTILQPHNAVAKLIIGDSILDVEEPVLVVQAADVRRDNKQIAGAYVINGEMISRGEAKSGFCAIINDEITIGVAQNTPLLERATVEDGFFFRQYPLVYEGEVIENKPKNLSQRKALALLNEEVVVVLSHDKLAFNDFSQTLVDLGVRQAIYLIGSNAYLKARLQDGHIYEFGVRVTNGYTNTNYIYWQ